MSLSRVCPSPPPWAGSSRSQGPGTGTGSSSAPPQSCHQSFQGELKLKLFPELICKHITYNELIFKLVTSIIAKLI